MRTLVFGDIHGGLRALTEVLEKATPEPEDLLIFLGDYVDGWSDAAETIDFLLRLQKERKCVFLRGNHDELCLQWLSSGKENPLWLKAGGLMTQKSYAGVGLPTRKRHMSFLRSLQDYHLDQSNRLYVHAGFTNPKGVRYEYFTKSFYWDRTLWEMALSLNPVLSKEDRFYPARLKQYKEIFIGHTALIKIGITTPLRAGNVWNIDTGAAHMGPLSALEVQTKKFWQSQPVHLFYPGETGRN
ncbi:metallophosphoesterase family protein [Robiginitalea sp.]|uniref:metallophosphoesterase family protein n=1 Tax=Robiginitalea sp. TaxID=1902411 RepID=UPI003C755010